MKKNIDPILVHFKGQKFYLNLGNNRNSIVSKMPEKKQELDICTEWENDAPYFILYTTYGCNLSCPYCFHGGLRTEYLTRQPQYTFDDLYSFMCKMNITNPEIRFFGGEPLLNRKWICECVTYFEEKGINAKYNIFTNGTLIDDEFLKFCQMKNIRFFVSVAGHNEIEKGIKYREIIQENIRKVKLSKLTCFGRAVYKPEEISLVDLIKETMNTNLDILSVTPEWGTKFNYKAAYKDLIEFSDFYIDKIAHYEFDIIGIHPFSGYISKWIFGKQYDVNQCGCGKKLYSVALDGKIYPCHCFTEKQDFVCGSLDNDVQAIFGQYSANTIATCNECKIKYFCKYRCFADAFLCNGSICRFDDQKCRYENDVVACAAYILYTLREDYPSQYKIFYHLLKKGITRDLSH